MTSVRLTIDDKLKIVNYFVKQIDALMQAEYDKVGQIVQNWFDERTPQDVKDVLNKYPQLEDKILVKRFYSIGKAIGQYSGKYSMEIKVPGIVECLIPNWIERITTRYSEEFSVIRRDLNNLYKYSNETKNRLNCIMEKINTTKQLKEQLPEGYDFYLTKVLGRAKVSDCPENECDNVEGFRAMFNSVIKKK